MALIKCGKWRSFKGQRGRIYAHYRSNEIARNIQSSDRRRYWYGRFGASAKTAGVEPWMQIYPAWAAGRDIFDAHGAPDFDIKSTTGITIRETISTIQEKENA